MDKLRNLFAFILASLVLAITILALLGIWEVIEEEKLLYKSLWSIFTLFVSSAIIMFIFGVIYKTPVKPPEPPRFDNPPPKDNIGRSNS
jgi:vacuolar-type H+-ATPase subunit I/STV1